jgi:hypothetical protein
LTLADHNTQLDALSDSDSGTAMAGGARRDDIVFLHIARIEESLPEPG